MQANTVAQDAVLRDQILGSCRLITRHAEGLAIDSAAIVTMPNYYTEAERLLNETGRVIALAAMAIEAAKIEMSKKQLEKV
jgi:hypothetical protein